MKFVIEKIMKTEGRSPDEVLKIELKWLIYAIMVIFIIGIIFS